MNPKRTALIIEDEDSLRKALSEKFKKSNFNVLTAQDGSEGLSIALEHHPNIILTDLLMPKKDGWSFLDDLRRDSWGSAVPVIVLTNVDLNDQGTSKVVDDHPSYYLVKSSVELEELVTKVNNILNGAGE